MKKVIKLKFMIILHSAGSLLMWEQCHFQMLFAEPPKDLIRKLLVVDPKKRITIKEALEHPFFQMMVRILTSSTVLCSCDCLVP
jgi:serine/threonine protein kinase